MVYDVGYQSMESRKFKQSFRHDARKFTYVLRIVLKRNYPNENDTRYEMGQCSTNIEKICVNGF